MLMSKIIDYPANFQSKNKWSRSAALLTTSLVIMIDATHAFALPGDGNVVAGQASLHMDVLGQMNIFQTTDKAIINWNSFSIGTGETVRFLQPGQSSLTVNRVTGYDPSHILGTMTANGQIMLINPNGILFGSSAKVDVHSLIATTIDTTDERLLKNDFRFDIVKNPSSAVINRGSITAAEGGLVALVAPGVRNDGIIQARLGKVTLAGAEEFSVDLYGDGLISLPVSTRTIDEIFDADGNALSESVSNKGTIHADGGQVVLSARTAKNVIDDVVNMEGVIEARSVGIRNGVISLDGGAGKTKVSGRLDVSGKNTGESSGRVSIASKSISLEKSASIDATGDAGGGIVHVGGEYQGSGNLPRADSTVVKDGARIDASAITSGNGGEVIVWADDHTIFGGSILSNGGAISGNGGVIETSGRGKLSVLSTARVAATAPNGNAGLWLLDPRNVYLRSFSGDDVSAGGVYNPNIDDASVDIDTILLSLAGGTSVTITTQDALGMQSGDIILEDSIIANTLNNATLSLLASNDIVLGGHSITSTGMLNIAMNAGGSILQSGGAINSDGGSITLTASDMTLNGTINAGAGTVTLLGVNGQAISLGGISTGLNLSASEIDNITAGTLNIGNVTSGAISILSDIATNASTLSLRSGSTITGTDGGIIAGNLSLAAAGAINISHANTSVNNLSVAATGQNFIFRNASNLNIGTVGSVNGLTASNATITVNGVISQSSAVNVTGLAVAATNDVILTNAANNASVVAVNANASNISYTDINGFDIGLVGGVSGLTGNNISLQAGGNLSDSRGSNVSGLLTIQAGSNSVTLDHNANSIAELSLLSASSASIININNLTLKNSSVSGLLTVRANNGITVDGNVSAGGGIVFNADNNSDSTGDVIILAGNILSSGNSEISITAKDVDISGSIVSGTGLTTITNTNNGTIDLGDGGAGSLNLNSAELSRITADTLKIGHAGSGAINISSTINSGSSVLHLQSGSTITATMGGIVATSLALQAGGAIDISHNATNVSNLAAYAAGHNITINESNGFQISSVNAVSGINGSAVSLTSGGALTSNASIVANSLDVNSSGAVTLDNPANNVVTLSINAGPNNISYRDTNGFDIGGITGDVVYLRGAGAITDSGAILANSLGVENTTHVTLDYIGSNVSTLAVNTGASGNFSYSNAGSINIGNVSTLAGITGNAISIISGGEVTDTSPTVATSLNITSAGNITLDHASNNLTSFGASAAGRTVRYTDLNAIDLLNVTADTFILTAGGNVTDTGRVLVNNLGISTSGAVTLNTINSNVGVIAVNSGTSNNTFYDEDSIIIGTVGALSGLRGGVMTLVAGGAVEANAVISGTSLAVTAGGDVTLNNVANSLTNLAVSAAGYNVQYRDTNALNITSISGVNGITAGAFSLLVNGNLADSGTATLNVSGHTNIVSTSGTIALDNTGNDYNTLSVSHTGNITNLIDANFVEITGITRTSGAGTANISSANGMTISGDISTGALTLNSDRDNNGSGVLTINNAVAISTLSNAAINITSGDIIINGSINSGTGVTTVQASGSNTIDLGSGGSAEYNISQDEVNRITAGTLRIGGTASGAMTISSNITALNASTLRLQAPGITGTAGAIIQNNLAIYSSGAVNMTNAANNVNNLAISASGQTVSYTDANGFVIGSVDGTNGATATTLRLEGSGLITDSQALSGTNLAVISNSAITLDHANNSFTNIAFSAAGQSVRYHDINAVAIGTVSGIEGVQAENFHLTTTNGNITDSARSIISGLTTLNAGTGSIILDLMTNDFNTVTVTGASALTINDANTMTLNAITASGNTTLQGTDGLIVDGNITVNGTLFLNGDRNVNNNGTLVINSGRTVSTATANQTITLAGADLNILGSASVNSGTASTILRAGNSGRSVNIGGAGAVYNVSQSEIDAITAGVLHIQSGTAASNITIEGNITAANAGALYLQSGSGGINADNGSIVVNYLALQSIGTGNINFSNIGNSVNNLAMSLDTGNGYFYNAGSLNFASVAGIDGLNTSLTSGAGRTIYINSAGLTDSVASSVRNFGFTSSGNIVLDHSGNNFIVVAGEANGQNVTLTNNNDLIIGQVNTLVPSTISGISSNNLTLNNAGSITDTHQSNITSVLTINAGTNAVTLDHAGNDFNAAQISSAGNVSVFDTNNVNLSTSNVTGSLYVVAEENIVISGNVTTSGLVTITADSNNDGVGFFAVDDSRVLNSSNSNITISTADLILDGNINSGTADTIIRTMNGRTIGVGLTSRDMTISKDEIKRITAKNLRIGGAQTGSITVDGVDAGDFINIDDSLYIQALSNGSDIYFANNASFFKNMYGEADDAIFVDQDLTATIGQISLRADIDGALDTDGDQIYVTQGISITSIGNSLFESTNGITIGQNINIFGNLIINADTDNDGIGLLTLLGGFDLKTNNFDLSLIAGDFSLNGNIDAGLGEITIRTTNGRSIGLGDAIGDASIDKLELQKLRARSLYVGGDTISNIYVDNIESGDVSGISGLITLAALNANSNIVFNNAASSFSNGLSLIASNNIDLNQGVMTNGAITIVSDNDKNGVGDLSVANGSDIVSQNNDISILANDVNLLGSIDSGSARTIIQASDKSAITLGGAGAGLSLSADELNRISSSILTLGVIDGGSITISSDVAPINTDTLVLLTGGSITGSAGALSINNLGFRAGGNVNLTNINTNVDKVAGNTISGNITINTTNDLTIGSVDSLAGLTTSGGNISLSMNDIHVENAVNVGVGEIVLEGRDNKTIGLGGVSGDMNLSSSELGLLTANILRIGQNGSGAIVVNEDISFSSINRLVLETGGSISATAGGIVVPNLTLQSGGNVAFTDLSTNVDTLTVNASGQDVVFFDNTSLSAAITANSGNISANNGLTITNNWAANGIVILNADADNNGSGTFTLSTNRSISTGNNALNITAADIVINSGASLNSGSGTASVLVTNGGQINLGGTGLNMNLSNPELAAITANNIVFGDATSGAITLHNTLTHNASNITLHSGGAITATLGGLVVSALNLIAGGAINFAHALTNVDQLHISAAGQNVSFRDSNGVNLSGVTANNMTLNAGGAVTDSLSVKVNNLSVTATGAVTLDHSENDADTINIQAGSNNVIYNDTNGFDISGLQGGIIDLTASGNISGSGMVVGTTLNVLNTGNVILNSANNDVSNLSITASGRTVSFTDVNGINIAGVDADIFNLNAGGNVTDSTPIIARNLNILSAGNVTLDTVGNDVDTLSVLAAGRNVTFTDVDEVDLAGITANSFSLNANGSVTDSAQTVVNTLSVTTTGPVNLDAAGNNASVINIQGGNNSINYVDVNGFDIAGLTGGLITLNAAGALTDSGQIIATTLNILNSGDVTLNNANNQVVTLSVSASGRAVNFTNSQDLTLSGITSECLTLNVNGSVTDNNIINVGTLSITSTGDITLDEAGNDVNNLSVSAAGRSISFVDVDGINLAGITADNLILTAGGNVTDSNSSVVSSITIAASGDVILDYVNNNTSQLNVNAGSNNISFTDVGGFNISGITGNTVSLVSNGAITDTGIITSGSLHITSGGSVMLDEVGHTANNLSLSSPLQTANILLSGGTNLAGITANSFTLNASGNITQSASLNTNTLNIVTTGSIVLNNALNNSGTIYINSGSNNVSYRDEDGFDVAGLIGGIITLNAGGSLTDSGIITADSLNVISAGDVTFNTAANDVDTLSVLATGRNVTFVDANEIDLAGIYANRFSLISGGEVTDSDSIVVEDLIIHSSGNVTLDDSGNDVAVLTINASGQNVVFNDLNDIDLAGILAQNFNLTANGIITDSNSLSITGHALLDAGWGNDIILDVSTNDFTSISILNAGDVSLFDLNSIILDNTQSESMLVQAISGIAVEGNISTDGALVLDADADDNGDSNITLGSASSLVSNNNAIEIIAADAVFNGLINSGSSSTSIISSNSRSITLGGIGAGMSLSNAELSSISASVLRIGDMSVDNIVIASDISFDHISQVKLQTGGNITGIMGGISAINFALLAGTGIHIDDASTSVSNLAASTLLGNIEFVNDGDLSVTNIDGVNGIVAISGNVSLQADDFSILGQINNTGGITSLTGRVGETISLGGSGGDVVLSNTELNNITASILRIGNAATGNIVIAGNISPSNISTLHLHSGDSVTGTVGGVLVDSLAIRSENDINLTNDYTSVSKYAAHTVNGDLNFVNNGAVDITMVDGVDGLNVTNGNVTLRANDINLLRAINNAGGITTLLGANGGTISLGGVGGDLSILDSELDEITADIIRIGNSSTGNITVVNDISPANTSVLSLQSGGTITSVTGGIIVNNLAMQAAQNITVTNSNTDVSELSMRAIGQTMRFNDINNINIGVVDGIAGISGSEFYLVTGGAISDTAILTLNDLNITSAGPIVLDMLGHDIDNLYVFAFGEDVTYTDVNAVNLAGIIAENFYLTANGAITDSVASNITGETIIDAGSAHDIILDEENDFYSLEIISANNVDIYDENDITIKDSLIYGSLNVDAQNGILVDGVVWVSDNASLNSDVDNDGVGQFAVNAGDGVTTQDSSIHITASDLILLGWLDSGNSDINITASNNGSIGLGTDGDMEISASEMSRITADILRIGTATTSSIDIGDMFNLVDIDTLKLHSAGTIGGIIGGISVENLTIKAGDAVSMNALSNNVSLLAIDADTASIGYRDISGFTVGSVDGVSGISGGNIVLTSGGALNGAASIVGNNLTINSAGTVDLSSQNNDVSSLSVNASGQNVSFKDISALNLAGITAQNLSIVTNGQISSSQALVVSHNLSLASGSSNDVVINHANNDISSVNIISARNVDIRDSNNLYLDASDISGSLNVEVDGNLVIADAVNVSGGVMLDVSPANSGVLTIANTGALSAAGQAITISAHDVHINGALLTGSTGTVTLRSTTGAVWALGDAAGQFSLSGSELANINTGILTVGGADAGDIFIQNVTQAHTASIGRIVLQAHGNLSSIQFGPGASTFRELIAEADAEIRVLANLTTNEGVMILNGDYDDFFDLGYANNVVYGSGVQIRSQGDLRAFGSTGSGVMQGPLTMSSVEGDIFVDSINGAYNLTMDAGDDGDITITGSLGGVIGLNNILLNANRVTGDVHGKTIKVDANEAVLTGTVNGFTDNKAADFVMLEKLLPGPYLMNGHNIEGYIPPIPNTLPVINSGGSSDPVSMFASYSTAISHQAEFRSSTVGDLVRQDPLRRAFIPDILNVKDVIFNYSRDFWDMMFMTETPQKRKTFVISEREED
jgi:hypothetical protein